MRTIIALTAIAAFLAITPAYAWQGEGDTVNPGETAPGATGGIGSGSGWDDKGGPSQTYQGGSFKYHGGSSYSDDANGKGSGNGNAAKNGGYDK